METPNWKVIMKVLTQTAEKTCRKETREISYPGMKSHEEELAVLSMNREKEGAGSYNLDFLRK